MLCMALKNFILGLLILLILHFLFKNIQQDRGSSNNTSSRQIEGFDNKKNQLIFDEMLPLSDLDQEYTDPVKPNNVIEETVEIVDPVETVKETKKNALDALFENASVSKTEDELYNHVFKNFPNNDNTETKKKETSVPNQNHAGHNINESNKQVYSPHFIINDFENEGIMNGGRFFDDVNGYDESFDGLAAFDLKN